MRFWPWNKKQENGHEEIDSCTIFPDGDAVAMQVILAEGEGVELRFPPDLARQAAFRLTAASIEVEEQHHES